ncbi:MAG: PhnD/SsuA/transferrin family substrate-binding protein [Xanthomonadales bacterium]|nr:PhnD/SsuA/transferrin family substrate-binding protein [Xanthomonadales bacterium]MCB1626471.1 PhnD/SsuA/transferrin family substrate-binding protein [Xanthomonadales bacterium]MCB1633648.1 PhnD/SsuA/transferrin family substrate-binding protein [Xanthomonadales bacterium]MCB1642487.1 PhnD/SsuA/transferrin family substrate-binding protein [Xanthomonadales bacterium]
MQVDVRQRLCAGLVLWATGALSAQAADVNLAVEPFHTPERAPEVYAPLIAYLNNTTGHNFKLITARNYHFYWSDLRSRADIDIAFEEAHFVDYRASHFGYVPLAKSVENTSYSLLTLDPPPEDEDSLRSLVARRLVCMPAPNLGFALLLELYPNPMQQPDVRSSATSWRESAEIIFAGEADAAMAPTWLQNLYPNLYPVHQTRQFPGAAFSASPRLDPDIANAVREALLKLHEDPELYEVLNELGVSQFVDASASEYAGSESMLKAFYGYGDDSAPKP